MQRVLYISAYFELHFYSPALLFDWLITLILTVTVFDNIVLEKSADAGSKSGVCVDFYGSGRSLDERVRRSKPKPETSPHVLVRISDACYCTPPTLHPLPGVNTQATCRRVQ